ncbi:MAG: hypothetical protein ABEJ40_03925 [Haloarculaceae archaeon]
MKRCDQCLTTFDGEQWHPAMLDDATGEIHEFCSTECKQRFVEQERPEGAASRDSDADDELSDGRPEDEESAADGRRCDDGAATDGGSVCGGGTGEPGH